MYCLFNTFDILSHSRQLPFSISSPSLFSLSLRFCCLHPPSYHFLGTLSFLNVLWISNHFYLMYESKAEKSMDFESLGNGFESLPQHPWQDIVIQLHLPLFTQVNTARRNSFNVWWNLATNRRLIFRFKIVYTALIIVDLLLLFLLK